MSALHGNQIGHSGRQGCLSLADGYSFEDPKEALVRDGEYGHPSPFMSPFHPPHFYGSLPHLLKHPLPCSCLRDITHIPPSLHPLLVRLSPVPVSLRYLVLLNLLRIYTQHTAPNTSPASTSTCLTYIKSTNSPNALQAPALQDSRALRRSSRHLPNRDLWGQR
jgi:hypothetical protein